MHQINTLKDNLRIKRFKYSPSGNLIASIYSKLVISFDPTLCIDIHFKLQIEKNFSHLGKKTIYDKDIRDQLCRHLPARFLTKILRRITTAR
jgi:hypothetical protein